MWSAQDLQWLATSGFNLKSRGRHIEGWISFTALYDGQRVIINPSQKDIDQLDNHDSYIHDQYKVRIGWQTGYDKYPYSEEIGGRVDALAKRLGKRLADLHVYENSPNFLCDSGPRDLNRAFVDDFSLKQYILEFLIPRLYAQSYYERYEDWPWGELSHDFLGLFEWFARAGDTSREDLVGSAQDIIKLTGYDKFFYLVSKKYGANHRCVCQSGRKLKDCHHDVLLGIWRMRKAIKANGMTLTKLVIEASSKSRQVSARLTETGQGTI